MNAGGFFVGGKMAFKGAKNPRWNGGVAEYPSHSELKKNRLIVLREANYICQVCGGKATQTHHKDKSKTNHAKENLLPVCCKCNASFHRDVIGRKPLFSTSDTIKICQLYLKERLSQHNIAKRFNCSQRTISDIIKRRGLKTRSPSETMSEWWRKKQR